MSLFLRSEFIRVPVRKGGCYIFAGRYLTWSLRTSLAPYRTLTLHYRSTIVIERMRRWDWYKLRINHLPQQFFITVLVTDLSASNRTISTVSLARDNIEKDRLQEERLASYKRYQQLLETF